jgi:hypothetical protein
MIRALTPQGTRRVSEWLRSPTPELALGPEHTRAVAGLSWSEARLSRLQEALDARSAGEPALDALIAPALHASLPLGRRLASDRHVWAWLGVGPLRAVLQRRWTEPSKDRYLGSLTQHGLARLWWAAELTCAELGDPYASTRRLVQWQYLLDRVLRSRLVRSKPVMLGVLDALAGSSDWRLINGTMQQLGALASTICLEAMDRAEVGALVGQLAEDVRAREGLEPP